MKSYLYILICFITFLPFVHSQEGQVVLTNNRNSKKITIEAGNYIKVYKSKESYLSGHLNLIDSATIAVGSDTIALSDIEWIVAKTSGTKKGGAIVVSAGMLTLGGGLAILLAANEDSSTDWVPGIRGAGIALVVVGATTTVFGIGNLTFGKNYKKARWEYSVRKGTNAKPLYINNSKAH